MDGKYRFIEKIDSITDFCIGLTGIVAGAFGGYVLYNFFSKYYNEIFENEDVKRLGYSLGLIGLGILGFGYSVFSFYRKRMNFEEKGNFNSKGFVSYDREFEDRLNDLEEIVKKRVSSYNAENEKREVLNV